MDSKNTTASNNYTSACLACEHPDWVDDMVQCEECCGWYHFRCVGVTRSVELRHWACSDCLPISVSSQSSRATISRSLAQQRLEEEQQIHRKRFLKEKALEKELIEREKRLIAEEEEMEMTFLLEKFALLEEHEADEERSVASNRSRCRVSREKIVEWMRNDGSDEPKASTPNETGKAPNPEITLQSEHSRSRNLVSSRSAGNQYMTSQQLVAPSNRVRSQNLAAGAVNQKLVPCIPPVTLLRRQSHVRISTPAVPLVAPSNAADDDASIVVPPMAFECVPSEVEVELPPPVSTVVPAESDAHSHHYRTPKPGRMVLLLIKVLLRRKNRRLRM